MNFTNAIAVINYVTELFAIKGTTPRSSSLTIGNPSSSKEIYTFIDKYSFKHTTYSPQYAQSNSFIEWNVQTSKVHSTKLYHL